MFAIFTALAVFLVFQIFEVVGVRPTIFSELFAVPGNFQKTFHFISKFFMCLHLLAPREIF